MKADKKKINRLLNTAKGQLNGISKMIEEDRYCLDISNQIMATEAILRKVNEEILKAHMNHCVKEALIEGDGEEKIDEIFNILNKLLLHNIAFSDRLNKYKCVTLS